MSRSDRRRRTALTVVFVVIALFAAGLSATAEPADRDEPGQLRTEMIDAQLQAEVDAVGAGESIEYLVALEAEPDLEEIKFDRDAVVSALKETAAESQRPVVEYLASQGQQVLNTFWLANLVLVRSSATTMTSLTAIPGVESVLPVREVEAPEPTLDPVSGVSLQTVDDRTWGVDRIGAHRVWDELGLDGSGVRVAVLDTGVDVTHPDLADKMVTDDPADPTFPGGWMEFDAAGNPVASEPRDSQFHGTHVSGTVHGGDNFQAGTAIGAAPGADMMHGMVLPDGSGTVAQIVAGMQWTVAPHDAEGNPAGAPAHVVNMSFGPQGGGVIDDLVEPIRNMYAAGVLPVSSSGNAGDGRHGSPGNVFEALAVGATDIDDDVASFSSGGLAQASDFADPPAGWPESWTVPDVSAPGVDVISSVPPGTFPEDSDAIYGRASGTSMASPHAAATAALLLAGDPSLTIDDIADLLLDTSFFDERHGAQRPNSRFGHGRIDAFQSAGRIVLDSGITGQVTDAATGEPVTAVDVEVVQAGVTMRTGADGRYDIRLQPGTYTLEFSWSGQLVTTVPDVVVSAGELTSLDIALSGIAGQVTDGASGDPVADVSVEVAGTDVSASMDADGGYRLYLAPGRYTLELSWSDRLVATAPDVVVDTGAVTERDVALAGMAGRVTDSASGDPVADATVEVAETGFSVSTGGDGRYRFYLAPGTYGLEFSAFGYEDGTVPDVAVTEGELTTVDAELEPLPVGTITGTVTLVNSGHGIPGVTIEADDTPLAASTGADGTYTIHDVPVGSYSVVARADMFPDAAAQQVTIGSGDNLVVDFTLDCGGACQLDELWESRFDGSQDVGEGRQAGANAMGVSPDGARVFVAGSLNISGVRSDYATVAYDATSGDELWRARYNGPNPGRASVSAVGVSPNGSRVYVTGGSLEALSLRGDAATVAYDAVTGEELWTARYDGPSDDHGDGGVAMGVSPDGSRIYIAVQSSDDSGLPFRRDYATVVYDAVTGEELWVARYRGPVDGANFVQDLDLSIDGSQVFVTGFSGGDGSRADYATVAYDTADGAQRWVARYDGPASSSDQAGSIAVGTDGVYVTGASTGVGSSFDYATVAYDPTTGQQRWVARYNGPVNGIDTAADVAVSPNGSNVYVTGEITVPGVGFAPRDAATVAYDAADGAPLWDAVVGPSTGRDAASDVEVSPDGSRVFVTGLTLSQTSGSDYLTLAHDAADGRTIWAGQYDGPANLADFPNAMALSMDGSRLFVAGHSRSGPAPGFGEPGLDTGVDFGTVAYDAEADEDLPVFVPYELRVEHQGGLTSEPVSVSVAVTNVGVVAGEYTATLLVDGELEDSTTVRLESGAATEVSWPVARDEPGRYEVRVGHLAGELRVLGCDDTVTDTHTGPLTVTEGVTCLAEGSRVAGPVRMQDGAGLVTTGATVTGPVLATGADLVWLRDSRFAGPVTVTGASDSLVVSDNRITGPVRLSGNTTGDTPIVVSGNRIVGSLSCSGNQPPPVNDGASNTVVGPKSGQCAGL